MPGDEMTAHAGDLLLGTAATGFAVRMLQEGEPVSGVHAIVIRASDGGPVTSSWLLLWTRTEDFAGLVEGHAKGTTIRSVSVKDLVEFELEVPTHDVQARGEELLERLDHLAALQDTLNGALDRLRSAELRLTYAEVTQ